MDYHQQQAIVKAIHDVGRTLGPQPPYSPSPPSALDKLGPGFLLAPVWLAAIFSGLAAYAVVTGFPGATGYVMHLPPLVGAMAAVLAFAFHLHLLRYRLSGLVVSAVVSLLYAAAVFNLRNDAAHRITQRHLEQAFLRADLQLLFQTFAAGANGWAVIAFLISAFFHWAWWDNARGRRSMFWYAARFGLKRCAVFTAVLGVIYFGAVSLKW